MRESEPVSCASAAIRVTFAEMTFGRIVMLRFDVSGSSGDPYVIEASRDGSTFTMTCTCKAGAIGQLCKHRVALLDGDVTSLRSENSDDVKALRGLIEGSEAEAWFVRCAELEAAKASIDRELKAAKKKLAASLFR